MNGTLLIFMVGAGAFLLAEGAKASGVIPPGQLKYIYWTRWDDLFKKYAAQYGVNWRHVKATAIVESSLGQNPLVLAGTASSDGKSYGLTQFTLPTANDMRPGTTVADLNNPEISIMLAAKYLSILEKMFPSSLQSAIISYNQGPGNTQKGKDYTGNYWQKWQDAYKLVLEG